MVEPPETHRGLSLVLQNGMASPYELALALLDEFYRPVYRLASAMHGEAQAQAYSERAFVLSMLDVKNYRESSELILWFYRNVLKVLAGKGSGITEASPKLARDLFPGKTAAAARLPILLHSLAGLTASQIATLLGADEDRIALGLPHHALPASENNPPESDPSAQLIQPDRVDDEFASARADQRLIEKSIDANWPAPDANPEHLAALAVVIAQKAAHEGERMGLSGRRRQALAVGVGLVAVLLVLFMTSPIKADQIASRVTVVTQVVTRIVTATPPAYAGGSLALSPEAFSADTVEPTRGPVLRFDRALTIQGQQFGRIPTPHSLFALNQQNGSTFGGALPGQLALSENSSANEIARAIRSSDSRYTSLWIDAVATFYAPTGYTGPDRQYRYQVWANQDQVLVLGGPPDGLPSETWVGDPTHLETFTPSTSPVGVAPADWGKAYSLKRPLIGGLDLLFNPNLWGNSAGMVNGRNIKLAGMEQLAGRQALVVEKLSLFGQVEARLWIDTQTGLILRNQQYRAGSDVLEMVFGVQSIAYDAPYTNPALFNLERPWIAGFAKDSTGKPAVIHVPSFTPGQTVEPSLAERKAPPAGFNPAHSQLTFLYPAEFDLKASEVMVSLYGDSYYLGEIWMGNPWTTVCARSADGSKLAFSSKPLLNSFYKPEILWYDLTQQPLQLENPVRINADELAFAPDNKRLAVAGAELDTGNSGVFLVDLVGNKTRLLNPTAARSLVWRPDGQLLAMISLRSRFAPEAVVLNPDSGEVVDRSPLNASDLTITSDEWRVFFPAAPGNLNACTNPK